MSVYPDSFAFVQYHVFDESATEWGDSRFAFHGGEYTPTTVFDGIAYNYPVVLIDDATGASTEEVHRANVRDMQNIGVRIVKTAEIPGILG